jgi:hypothetical protein
MVPPNSSKVKAKPCVLGVLLYEATEILITAGLAAVRGRNGG